jgi:hydroxypyruvate reductase
VLGIGKAAAAMARGLAQMCDVEVVGAIATPVPTDAPDGIEVIEGGHPMPTAGSLRGGERLLGLARAAGADDLVIVLISGGGSACAEVLAEGIGLDDLIATNDALLASGAPIEQINVVRKHLSRFKGGQLAQAVHPGRLVTLVLSDVVGNPLESIASGPTVPDPSTFADAVAIAADNDLDLPDPVRRHLEGGTAGDIDDTPTGGEVFDSAVTVIVGDAATAAAGARAEATRQGIEARVVSTVLVGEARAAGAALAAAGKGAEPGMLIYAGETTVTLQGKGRGGRNQELALGAAMALQNDPNVVVASMGTDGIDGPTPSAGAIADGGTVARGRTAGLDPGRALTKNDSGTFLEAAGDLLITGPTGTNVGDVMVVYRSELLVKRPQGV